MNVGPSLVSDCQASKAIEPGEAAFDDPAVLTKALGAPDASARYARLDVALAASVPAAAMIVCLVGVQLVWSSSWPATFAANRRYCVDDVVEWNTVVNIGAGELEGQQNVVPIRGYMPLCPGPPAICGIGAGRITPLFAAMDEASTQTRLQSI
jgi:hypothetical protein